MDGSRSGETATHDDHSSGTPPGDVRRVQALPREVGVLLIVAGIGGLVLPGPVGTPIFVMGCVALWPRAFARVEDFVEKRFPKAHRQALRQVNRFLDDLDRRYPAPR